MGIDVADLTDEELEIELRKMDENKEDFEEFKLNFKNLINESEEMSGKRYHLMNEIREKCDSEDSSMLADIEENQNILIHEQQRRREMEDDIKEEAKKQNEYYEYYEEDIKSEMKSREDKKDRNEKEN